MNNKLWVWGYTMPEVPGFIEYVNAQTYCSLETAADYLGADNVVYMNSMHDINYLNEDLFKYIADKKQILCALPRRNFIDSAKKMKEFAKKHPNIIGVVIDDFTVPGSHDQIINVDELKQVHSILKQDNPDFKIYVIRYAHNDIDELAPYMEWIDGINFWVWISTEHYWRYQYPQDIAKLCLYKKPILQGVFLQNYGEPKTSKYEEADPTSLDMLKLQLPKIISRVRSGALEGCVVLNNGWFSFETHRENVQWIREYLQWYLGTTTMRD
jgi:hypothetical protein